MSIKEENLKFDTVLYEGTWKNKWRLEITSSLKRIQWFSVLECLYRKKITNLILFYMKEDKGMCKDSK